MSLLTSRTVLGSVVLWTVLLAGGCSPSQQPGTGTTVASSDDDKLPGCVITQEAQDENLDYLATLMNDYKINVPKLQSEGIDGKNETIQVHWRDRAVNNPVSLERAQDCISALNNYFEQSKILVKFELADSNYLPDPINKREIQSLKDANNVRKMYGKKLAHELWIITTDLSAWTDNGVAGHSIMPFERSNEIDGILIDSRYLDTKGEAPFHEGETLIHEVGHWLGLNHPCGSSCDPKKDNDGISDTPICKTGCTKGQLCEARDSCQNQPGIDPCENIVENGGDWCRSSMTEGQKLVIYATLAGGGKRCKISLEKVKNLLNSVR
ncbi:MAG: hypothetical protein KF836_08345 [Fimbriimonadaceae bacterium]|nr:hypothetical protein [Fimbriimonadaceae bacterium]